MRFLSFVKFQMRRQILRKRWLLPIPLLLFLAYRSLNYLTKPGLAGSMQPVNAWDMLFLVFGNRFQYLFRTGSCCIFTSYVICCLKSNLGQLVLLRLRSRKAWWAGKTLTLLLLTLVYVLGSAGLLAGLASIVLPWQSGYSPQAQFMPDSVNLPMNFFRGVTRSNSPGIPVSGTGVVNPGIVRVWAGHAGGQPDHQTLLLRIVGGLPGLFRKPGQH